MTNKPDKKEPITEKDFAEYCAWYRRQNGTDDVKYTTEKIREWKECMKK